MEVKCKSPTRPASLGTKLMFGSVNMLSVTSWGYVLSRSSTWLPTTAISQIASLSIAMSVASQTSWSTYSPTIYYLQTPGSPKIYLNSTAMLKRFCYSERLLEGIWHSVVLRRSYCRHSIFKMDRNSTGHLWQHRWKQVYSRGCQSWTKNYLMLSFLFFPKLCAD